MPTPPSTARPARRVTRLLASYRATGADPPYGDPRLAHGVGMEGYYWRLSEPGGDRVVAALCGVCRDPSGGSWAAVALAVHPGQTVVERVVAPARAEPDALGVVAADAFRGDAGGVRVDLGPAGRLEVHVADPAGWPQRAWGALGPAHWVPGLGQYWHPHVLGGRATGTLQLAGERIEIDGWRVYAEKNWGGAFPRRWWWGQAHDFGDDDVCVAFAGGALSAGALAGRLHATGLVVRIGDEVIRLSAPTALVRSEVSPGRWFIAGHDARWTVTISGRGSGRPHRLPVPVPGERRVEPRAAQDLAGTMRVVVRRGRRQRFAGISPAAGLEYGS